MPRTPCVQHSVDSRHSASPVSPLPDAESSANAMAALVRGSDAALESLIDAWEAPVHRFIFRYIQDEGTARDLTQETFVRVYHKRAGFRPDSSFASWIFTIAANLCRNHRRWRWRHRTEPLDDSSNCNGRHERCDVAGPDRQLVATETSAAVRAAINALPPDLRCTVLLFEFDELSYRDIATVLGCSERGVETRLNRARNLLRVQLGPIWCEILSESRTS
jgi:RNA polymerase sigma-70 factor, ECF subfamily